jgi:DNA-binding transcriptional MerR regulator
MSHSVDDMCRAGGTTRRGVRFWEEQGLLGDVERSEGNQRIFTAEQLDRAKIIAAAQFGGWKLAEIKEMVQAYGPDVYEAIHVRLAQQANAAALLAGQLPDPGDPKTVDEIEGDDEPEYDL